MTRRVHHPAWCLPKLCRVTEKDVTHRSAPTMVPTDGDVWEGWLSRLDEHAHAANPGPVCLEVDVTSTGLVKPQAQHMLLLSDVPQLAGWLMAHYSAAALLLGHEVER